MLPLEGMLVVAIEQAVAAPLCTSRLCAAGARVVKIERPEGDFARAYDSAAKGESTYFTWLNQGKESACINFKSESGAQVLRRMIEQADVLVQNLSPGALARAGFSTQEMHRLNPALVICNLSGYGSDEKVLDRRGYDLLVQAESGLISVSGSPGQPGRIGVSLCDIGAGLTAYSGVMEALFKRERTGVGEELSVSLFDVAADWMAVPFMHSEYGEGAPTPSGLKHPSIAPYGAFQCADEKQVLISIQNEREWQRLCRDALETESLFVDERFLSNSLRVQHRGALESAINAITTQLTAKQFQAKLAAAGIAFGVINDASDLSSHIAFRGADYTNSGGQTMTLPAPPIQRRGQSKPADEKTPLLGEHTDAILREFAG